MKLNKGNKRGISLIVLVITIIVMIILAAAIILSLNSSGIIGKANKAKLSADKANMLEAAGVVYAEYQLEKQMGELEDPTQTAEAYVKDKLDDQFTADTLAQLSVLSDGTIQALPIIPEGFVMSPYAGEQKVSDGLVIYEATAANLNGKTNVQAMEAYNQYVWVPVPDISEFKLINWQNEIDFETKYVEPITSTTPGIEDISNYANEIAQYNAMKASVETNGGFYIARYEAGKEGTTAVSKKSAEIWNNIAWDSTMEEWGIDTNDGAAKVSKDTTSYSNAIRHLIYGVEWDATMNFIANTKSIITDSSVCGNYSNYNNVVDESKQIEDAGWVFYETGYSDFWKIKNIYDIAGNVWEWTYEASKYGCRVLRGGSADDDGSSTPVTFRCSYWSPSIEDSVAGFRMAMYIK